MMTNLMHDISQIQIAGLRWYAEYNINIKIVLFTSRNISRRGAGAFRRRIWNASALPSSSSRGVSLDYLLRGAGLHIAARKSFSGHPRVPFLWAVAQLRTSGRICTPPPCTWPICWLGAFFLGTPKVCRSGTRGSSTPRWPWNHRL